MPEVLWTICAILGVLVLAYLFTRYVAGRGQGGGPSRLGKRMLTILDQVAVGKDQRLLLVRAGETYYFLGVTQGSITCLEKLTAEEAEAWGEEADVVGLEPFVLLLRARGARPGVYRVGPDGADLVREAPSPEEIEGMTVQKEFARAGAIVSVAANLDEADAWGGAAGYRFTMSRSAALIYSLHLRAVARGLVGTVFAGFATSAVRHLLDSDGVSRHQMFAVTIASPQTEPPG